MKTLLLDPPSWDMTVDSNRNIATVGDPYSQAQDAASAIKLFQGELWYDTTKGIPYWVNILGLFPPLALVKQYFVAAALSVPGVTAAKAFIASFKNRRLSGQVQIKNANSTNNTAFTGF